ncbi:MAG: prephenate dehydrogenase [Rhodothermaceae bacterium]|nr:MAG: prephenate dehydrogenase [Rhodothermaceae bacterium]
MIERIALVGVGLIGGSLGLAWKRHRPEVTLAGYDREDVLARATARGIVDEAAGSLEAAVAGADLVVLAVPIAASLRLIDALAPLLRPGVLVTDVGSVKSPVVRHARAVLPPENPFIGGHPMAGAEHSGVEHADAFLFENATYVLCPPEDTPPEAFQTRYDAFVSLIRATGARVLLLEAERHDRIAAVVSHLPQLLAVTLMNYAATHHEDDDHFLRLAAGGFRDLTRIASSPFDIWRDILLANEGPILDALAGFMAGLQKLRNRLIEEDLDALASAFDRARSVRETIPRNTKGFLHPLVDVFVYVEDRPGALLDITRTLFEAGLSIKDIELLKLREGTGGTFRLGFAGTAAADAAVRALEDAGYRAYRL